MAIWTVGVILLGVHVLASAWDGWVNLKGRNLPRLVELACLAAAMSLVSFAAPEPAFKLGYLVFSLAAIVASLGSARSTPTRVRAIVYLLEPLVLGFAFAMWPFMDGVSLFLGMVLPFKVDGLKNLMTAETVALGVLCGVQIFGVIRRKPVLSAINSNEDLSQDHLQSSGNRN